MSGDRLTRLLTLVGAVTAVSGAVQLVAPGRVLTALGAESSPATRQGFATVGMFMTVVGGLQFQELRSAEPRSGVVAWGAVQKLGAAAAVTAGVRRGVFRPPALLVAGQDAASGVAALAWCLRRSRSR